MNEWRDIPGLPLYEITDYGDVRRKEVAGVADRYRGLWIKPTKTSGYKRYGLWADGKQRNYLAARLVLLAFVGQPPTAKHQAAHNDGDRLNNHVSNLRWATAKENHADQRRHGTKPMPRAKLTPEQIEQIRTGYASGKVCADMAAQYGVHPKTVQRVAYGRTWNHA